ncbi:Rap30/74 interaction domain-containing protein [Martensiomyces pterosporus]|nr:Rap30/74 interaction domain-containing protein [Martensiomyces pterosporus]
MRPAGLRPGQSASGPRRPRPAGAAATPAGSRPGAKRGVNPAPAGGVDAADTPLAATIGDDQGEVRMSTDYRLVSTARERTNNVMRFLTSKPVDLTTFTQPVKLRRRDRTYYRKKQEKLRAAAEEKRKAEEAKLASEAGGSMDVKEEDGSSAAAANGALTEQSSSAATAAVAAAALGKVERPKADTSIIAPFGGATRNKQMLFKKRTKQVFFADEEQRRLNIEEARPWVLEDYDEKESWTGSLEGGQKSNYVLFVLMDDGFKVIPVDRWYKFTPKLKYQTLTLDEAEEELKKAAKNETQNRWLMKARAKQQGDGTEDGEGAEDGGEPASKPGKLRLVEYQADDADDFGDEDEGEEGGSRKKKRSGNTKHGDADEMEFEEVFEDDEEMGDDLFGGDEDENEKQQQQQQQQNKKSELDSDIEEDEADELGSAGKEMKKLMRKRGETDVYDSDREENPYLSVSEDDSEEEEEANNEAGKQQQDQQQQQDKQDEETSAGKPSSDLSKNAATPKAAASKAGPGDASVGASSAKKRKRPATTPHHHANASGKAGGAGDSRKHFKPTPTKASASGSSGRAAAPAEEESPDLITEQEVIDLIKSGVTTTKELIGGVRKKLKANPANKVRIQKIVRSVATLKDGILSIKKR